MMRVLKRNNEYEDVSFDKVLKRLKHLSYDLKVNVFEVAQKVCSRIFDGVRTSELDELAAQLCSSMLIDHPDYGKMAARVIISNHHKNTSPSFSETIQTLYDNKDVAGNDNPLVSHELYDLVMKHKEKLNSYIDYNRDFDFDFFGFKTLERSYLLRINGKVIERPQHMIMRVALGIHGNDFKDALQTYDLISRKYFTHATPTLFNAGTNRAQMSSCFLLSMNGDSIADIFDSAKEVAMISKYAGGIGLHVHQIRAKGSRIRGTNGISDGIIPMLRVFNNTARYVNQCFTPNTIVYTKDGPMRMDQVTTNDHLVTIDGSFKKVNSISKQYVDKDIIELRTKMSFENVHLTPEHEVYVIPNQTKMLNYKTILNRLEKGIIKPKFVFAKDISPDDLVGYPIPTYLEDHEFDTDFCRFYGIMVGDGHITRRRNCDAFEYGVSVNNTSKTDTSRFVENYLQTKKIHYWTAKGCDGQDTYSIRWSNQAIGIEYDDLYCNGEKCINSKFLHLPEEKTLALVQGLLETDGHVDKEIYFHNSSHNVAMSLRYLLLRVGILSSGHVKNEIGKGHYIERKNGKKSYIETKKLAYVLRIPKSEKFSAFLKESYTPSTTKSQFIYNSIIWSRINKINHVKYSGDVYDFNMTDNHNYTVSSLGLVHNSGKRNGSIAVYLEPWHADIYSFLELRKNHGNEEDRCRDLFQALWVPDLFMERVKNNSKWSLMCPDQCRGLSDVYGEEFNKLYEKYEQEGKYVKQINAQDLWFKILEAQIEQGVPYIVYKDAANKKSNQQNLGTIKSSNLCSEIIIYSSPEETGVCNLASICLPTYVEKDDHGKSFFNFEKMHEVVKVVTKNLNKVIDKNFYPVEKARRSNLRHRPLGIGIQGLADVFVLLRMPFESNDAKDINKQIFETIYHASAEASMEISKKRHELVMEARQKGDSPLDSPYNDYLKLNEYEQNVIFTDHPGAYTSFEGSPASQGLFQFDLWHSKPTTRRYDWKQLKEDVMKYGMRNSLLLAPMPTASTSQIMGFNESFEAFTSNIFQRKTLSGEFIVINKYLINDLIERGLWNRELKDIILLNDGSIQNISNIPKDIKELYKTAWEIKQKNVIDMSADRGIYVCQTQSLNIFMDDPDFKKLSSMHFYGWQRGLKTSSYYLRTRPRAKTQQFTIDPKFAKEVQQKQQAPVQDDEDICLSCGA
jgi:ribonucleoside-diphosphate reductase alpha chain